MEAGRSKFEKKFEDGRLKFEILEHNQIELLAWNIKPKPPSPIFKQ